MSTTIDTNVVEMRFDNEQFEKNCAQSMSTLEKLQQKLDGTNSTKALDGFNKMNDVDFSKLNSTMDLLSRRFSTMGIAGMRVIQNLTDFAMKGISNIAKKIDDAIVQGGFNRASNIEKAKFQLEGLHVAWKDIYDDISYAVDGTAYGLDAAANAASQLVASGVEVGDSMKSALRGISGVAAMTNSQYEEIAPIFTTVAGQGKLMTMQLRQLEARGLNAAAILAESMGTTEAAVREMVTAGKIDFNMFAEAMDNAFGEHAKDANKTFTGVMSNIRSAFARIGADFITPVIENESPIVLMLQRIRERVNDVKTALQPLVKVWTAFVGVVGKWGQEFFGQENLMEKPMVAFYNVLHGVFNVFESLFSILKPIGQALAEVFPPITVNTIVNMTNSFASFTEKLKITDKHAEQLKTGFKGVFDVIKLLIDGITGAISSILGLDKGVSSLSDAFFVVIEAIGKFLSSIVESIRSSQTLTDIFSGLKNVISGFADALADALSAFSGTDSSGISKFSQSLKNATGPIEVFGIIFKGVFDGVYAVASTIVPRIVALIVTFGEKVGEGVGKAVKALSNGDGQAAYDVLNGGLLAFILTKLKSLVGSLTGFVNSFKPSFSTALSQLKDTLFAYQRDLEADALLKLAAAVAVLVGSLVMLTGIPEDELSSATAVIGSLMGALALVGTTLNGLYTPFQKSLTIKDSFINLTDSISLAFRPNKIRVLCESLILFSVAVGILAASVKTLASLPIQDLAKGTLAVTVLMGELVLLSEYLSKNEGIIAKGIGKLVLVAAAIDLLAIAVKSLGGMDWSSLAKGLVGVGVLLAELAVFTKMVNTKGILSLGAALIPLAAGIDLLTVSVKVLGSMDIDSLVKGIVSLGAVLTELALFSELVRPTKLLLVGAAMIPLAAGIDLLMVSVHTLGSMDLDSLIKGIASLGGVLTELALFSELVRPVKLLAVATAMIPLATGLSIISASVKSLGKMKFKDIAKGIGAIAAVLVELGVAAKLIPKAQLIALSAGLLIFSAALTPFAASMKLLSTLSWKGVAVGLTSIGGAIAILGAAAAILSPVIVPMMGVAAAVGILGTACLAAGVGVTAFATGLTALAALGTTGIVSISAALSGLATLIPTIVDMVIDLLGRLLDGFIELAPKVVEAIVTMFDDMLTTFANHMPSIVESGANIVISFLSGFAEKIPEIMKSATDLITKFLLGLAENMPKIVDAGFQTIISFINGLAEAIDNNHNQLFDAIGNLIESIVTAIGDLLYKMIEAGNDIVANIADGIWDYVGGPVEAIADIINDALDWIDEHLGDWFDKGEEAFNQFVDGMKAGLDFLGVSGFIDDVNTTFNEMFNIDEQQAQQNFQGVMVGTYGLVNSFMQKSGQKGGQVFAENLTKSVKSADLNNKAKKAGETAASNVIKGINSKSNDTYKTATKTGTVIGNGVVDGLNKKSSDAHAKGKEVGEQATKGLLESASSFLTEYTNMFNVAEATTGHNGMPSYVEEMVNGNYDVSNSAKKATESVEEYSEATQKAGGSSKKLSEDVTDLSGSFERFSFKTEKTAKELIGNFASQLVGQIEWAKGIAELEGKGLSSTLIASLKKAGTSSYAEVKAWQNASAEQIDVFNDILEQKLAMDEMSTEEIVKTYSEGGLAALEAYMAPFKNFDQELAENIQSDVNPFEEFDKASELSKTTLLKNMQSQIDGVTDWANKLAELSDRGINKELLQKLKDMGPSGYEYVAAFSTMTNDELERAGELWFQTMRLGEDAATILSTDYTDAAGYIMQGFVDGMDPNVASTELDEFAKAGLTAFNAVYAINSPSRVMFDNGTYIMQGLVNGIQHSMPKTELFFSMFADKLLRCITFVINADEGERIGADIVSGIARGIRNHESEAIESARHMAEQALSAAKRALGIRSPSREFAKVGMWIDQGLANGIDEYADSPINSITDLADKTMEEMNSVISRINSLIDDISDSAPVIRPELDLSEIQNARSRMSGMLSDYSTVTANAIVSSMKSGGTVDSEAVSASGQTVNNFNFNQTNNSPKALDRYEIYRDSRNLLGQVKGALS